MLYNEKQGIIRKVENTETNRTLFEMAQQLAYNEDKVSKIAKKAIDTDEIEILQDEMIEVGIYMTNDYLNQDREDKIDNSSPLQDKRDYFNENIEDITIKYYQDKLSDNDIKYDPETAQNACEEYVFENCKKLHRIMVRDPEYREEVIDELTARINTHFEDEQFEEYED